MPSPFPGMDPSLESPALWSDFHNNLAAEIRAHLNRLIQPRYFARLMPYVKYEAVEVGQTDTRYASGCRRVASATAVRGVARQRRHDGTGPGRESRSPGDSTALTPGRDSDYCCPTTRNSDCNSLTGQ
jgi:hypothetical protein